MGKHNLQNRPKSHLSLHKIKFQFLKMATAGDVKLIGHWASPYVIRALIALNIKPVKYEFLQEQFGGKSELLLKSNPVHKKIPVLIHGDKPISESLIIVQYIDEVWASGPSILPSDPYERAIARFWAAYLDDKWFPALRTVRMALTEEARQAAIVTVKEGFALLEEAFVNISKGKDFFGGDRIGFVDIAFGANLGWLKVIEKLFNVKLFDEAKTPNLFKWAEKFVSDPSAKDVIPETDRLADFAKVKLAQAKVAPY